MPLASFLYGALVHPQERLGLWKLRAKTVEGRVLEGGVGTGLNLRHDRKARALLGIEVTGMRRYHTMASLEGRLAR